jgi:hypothetical protein
MKNQGVISSMGDSAAELLFKGPRQLIILRFLLSQGA